MGVRGEVHPYSEEIIHDIRWKWHSDPCPRVDSSLFSNFGNCDDECYKHVTVSFNLELTNRKALERPEVSR